VKQSILDEITEPKQLLRRVQALDEELRLREFLKPKVCNALGLVCIIVRVLQHPGATIPEEEAQSDWALL
jgi:hypothetical protein